MNLREGRVSKLNRVVRGLFATMIAGGIGMLVGSITYYIYLCKKEKVEKKKDVKDLTIKLKVKADDEDAVDKNHTYIKVPINVNESKTDKDDKEPEYVKVTMNAPDEAEVEFVMVDENGEALPEEKATAMSSPEHVAHLVYYISSDMLFRKDGWDLVEKDDRDRIIGNVAINDPEIYDDDGEVNIYSAEDKTIYIIHMEIEESDVSKIMSGAKEA